MFFRATEEKWPRLFGQKFIIVKWGFADVVLSTVPLDEYVVAPAALAINDDGDSVVLEQLRKFQAAELAAVSGDTGWYNGCKSCSR